MSEYVQAYSDVFAVPADALLAGRERGLRIGTLQASGMGEPVYRGIGFETVSHLRHVTV